MSPGRRVQAGAVDGGRRLGRVGGARLCTSRIVRFDRADPFAVDSDVDVVASGVRHAVDDPDVADLDTHRVKA